MAPLPHNNTAVLFVDYTSGGQRHSAEVRLIAGSSAATALDAYNVLKAPIAAFLGAGDSVLGGRFRQAGSRLAFPIGGTGLAGTGGYAPDPERKPTFASWTGRSFGGRRCRFTIFTAYYDVDSSGYRNNTPNANETAIRNALMNNAVGACAIDGQLVQWNSYVNYGVNAYYQRKARRSG